ncbi:MAG: DUF58 domain-containing protein [Fimbriimonadales bacterium]
MRSYAVLTISVAAIFLLIVGAFLNTWPLFYMSTVMLVTLALLKLQAWLAVRGLKFERIAPQLVVAGERVGMRIKVWSTIDIKRPLLLIVDDLPEGLDHDQDLKPLPIAPSFDTAVETRYELMPLRRGVYRWSQILVTSYDSLGLIRVDSTYETDPFEVTIHPAKIPIGFDLSAFSGWGANQSDDGKNRGHGMEPRGVREYAAGDSMRHVHWPSTARTGRIQVKEFDTGFNTELHAVVQLTQGTEAGEASATTLEAMCGHLAHIADVLLQRGSTVSLPNLETEVQPANSATQRFKEVCDALAAAKCDRRTRFASEIDGLVAKTPPGSSILVLLTSAEEGVAASIRRLSEQRRVHVFLYDPTQYPREKIVVDFLPCTDKDFLASMSSQNVSMTIVPYPYVSDRRIA